jgi:hypothetical protein
MAHLISPKDKILTTGKHCCLASLGGRTPTEADINQGTYTETISTDGAGNTVTTWVVSDSGSYFLGDLYFTVCCYDRINITIGDEITPFSIVDVDINDVEAIHNEEIDEASYTLDSNDGGPAGDEFPPGACGMEVKFEITGDRSISFTLETN